MRDDSSKRCCSPSSLPPHRCSSPPSASWRSSPRGVNLGVEGMMVVGAVSGFAAAYASDSVAVGE